MHAIQTSGNCIRNVTADHFAGAAADEVADPRPYAEIIRQWSSLHPEFSFLPRKFKIAVTGAPSTTAPPSRCTTSACIVKRLADGELGFAVWVGGGQGRTPIIAKMIRDFLPEAGSAQPTCEAILRVYNLHGRRDNKYKARIKILVHEIGAEAFARAGRGGVAAHPRRRAEAARGGDRAHRGLFRAARASTSAPAEGGAARQPDRALRPLGDAQHARPQAAGLRHRHHLAEAHRRHPRRCLAPTQMDADRRSRRALLLRRGARHATSRTWCCRTCASATCGRSIRR